ncbi:unnamed protein product [Fusarium venenatum]|uniref:Uncharacterized protein n=1 Tax=Fusarium venenatum TaxID=56646 RepID=A0A2L2T887_9HYPO|nr:uncharacterized protein FVRRES_05857 [Fusarium venenatum]CEI61421.1 unnamed protein product [Fusarium venenatum]
MKITSLLTGIFAAHYASAELVYLVNSVKGNEISSGMAYYADGHSAENFAQPQDYTDVTHGSNVHWEGKPVKEQGNFSSGVSFTSNIFADAASKDLNQWAGSGNNGFKDFTCWKAYSNRGKPFLLYRVDGWEVYSIYFCRNNK